MRLSGRRWATAFAVAVLIHAGVVSVLLWQASDPGAGAAGPGVIRVSLGQAGGAPTSAANAVSHVPEAEMAAVVETAADSTIDEAVPIGATATAMPIEDIVAAKLPATSLPVEAVDAETDVRASVPDDAAPVEPVTQAVNIEASEPEAVAVAETAVALPVEEAALTEVPATSMPVEAVDAEKVTQAVAPDDAVPLEPDVQTVNSEASEPEAVAVAETAVEPPVEEAALAEVPATSLPVEAVDAEIVAQAAVPDDAVPLEPDVQTVNSEASEPEAVAVAETVVEPPVEEAVPTKVPATSLPAKAVNAEKVAQAVSPDDAAPLQTAVQAVDFEAPEREAIAVAETAFEPPVEEAAASPPPEPIRQTLAPADATGSGVVAPAEVPAGPEPVRTIETAVRQAETSGIPDTEPTTVRVPDAEEATVAEAVAGPPIDEVISTSPERIALARVPADSIEAEMVANIEPAVDSAPPDADVELVEPVQSVRDRPAQHPVSAATGGARDEVAGKAAVAPPSSGESDAGQSTMPATGSGAPIETVGNPAAHQRYLRKVLERIARFKRYPREARRDGVVGKVMVRFIVLADGSLQSPLLTGSSGDSRLDQAALDMLSRASPFPPIPRSLGVGKLELSLPVEFSLSQKRSLF